MGRRHTERDSKRQRKKEGERRDVYMSGITKRLAIYIHAKAQTSDSCRQRMQDVMHIKPDRSRLVWMIRKLSMNANYSAALRTMSVSLATNLMSPLLCISCDLLNKLFRYLRFH